MNLEPTDMSQQTITSPRDHLAAPPAAAERKLRRVFVTGGSGFVGQHLLGALKREGVECVALARSPDAARKVTAEGAHDCRSDLHDLAALTAGMTGCDTVIHVGAYLRDWGIATAMKENVQGSLNIAEAARRASVKRIVYVSGTGVTIGTGPVVQADETRPRGRPVGVLCASRVRSEAAMLGEASGELEVVVARFPYIWGPGETLSAALQVPVGSGQFRWINGGRHMISIIHVDNAVQGLLRAARRGRSGEIYWFTDGPPLQLREFFEAHIRRAGFIPPTREISFAMARLLADTMFFVWSVFGSKKPPPLTPTIVRFMGQEITVVDTKARRELGYAPTIGWSNASAA
jgi:nucleoside-diphosphate-sugar epimerase